MGGGGAGEINLNWSHVQRFQHLLDLGHKIRVNHDIVGFQLLHILVPFEGAGERFDNSQMKHLPDEGEGAGLAGGLLVAPRFPSR